jgi:hypothetical protein
MSVYLSVLMSWAPSTYACAVARGQSSSVSGKLKGGDRYTKRDVIQNVRPATMYIV